MPENVTGNEIEYCRDLVRAHDPDRFLLSLKAKDAQRDALWTLFAFNHEIAKTREVVSETTIGLIRLQWWRDALEKIYDGGEVLEHEVVTPLAAAIQQYDLPKKLFETLLYAREFDLEDVPPASIGGLLHYADYTNTPLLKLCLHVLGHDDVDEEQLRPMAQIYGVLGLLRAVPYFLTHDRMFIPSDLLGKYQISKDLLGKDEGQVALRKAVQDVHSALMVLHKQAGKPQDAFLKALYVMNGTYLSAIKRRKFDVFHRAVGVRPMGLPIRVLMA